MGRCCIMSALISTLSSAHTKFYGTDLSTQLSNKHSADRTWFPWGTSDEISTEILRAVHHAHVVGRYELALPRILLVDQGTVVCSHVLRGHPVFILRLYTRDAAKNVIPRSFEGSVSTSEGVGLRIIESFASGNRLDLLLTLEDSDGSRGMAHPAGQCPDMGCQTSSSYHSHMETSSRPDGHCDMLQHYGKEGSIVAG